MPTDIPLQPESEFTSDMVKAVENIAVNVKLGSAEFSSSIELLSKSIDGLKSSLTQSINSLKSSANNSRQNNSGSSSRSTQGKAPSSQDPVVVKQKEDEKRAKDEIKALKLKTARETANFNAEQLLLRIKRANEAEASRKKKKESSLQNQIAIDVFENVGKGFGDVFAVTEEQVAAMKSSKKKKKEKPFVMDMEALSTERKAGQGVDIGANFIGDITNASSAWNKVFDNVSATAKQWQDINIQQQNLASAFENIGNGFGQIFAVTKEQVAAMAKSTKAKKNAKEKPFVMDMEALASSNVAAGPGIDLPKSFIIGASNASDAWKNVFNEITVQTEKYNSNQSDISALMDDIRLMLGDATDQAQSLSLEMQLALDPRTYIEQAQDAIDGLGESISQQAFEVTNVLENLFYDIKEEIVSSSETASRSIPTTGKKYKGGYSSIGIAENYVSPNVKPKAYQGGQAFPLAENYFPPNVEPQVYQGGQAVPLVSQPTQKQELPASPFVGPTQKDELAFNLKRNIDQFSVLFDAMFGRMGNTVKNTVKDVVGESISILRKNPLEAIGQTISAIISPFKSVFGKKSKKFSYGGTVGYFSDGGEADSEDSVFKPKGTDTVPAMLTPGEEVVKKSAAEKPENKKIIDAMNKSSGGKVGYFAGGTPSGGGGGIVGGIASLALGPVGQAFSVLTGSVKAASDAIGMFGSFVAKNNPAIMEQVGLAMNDLQGVVGRALVPAVQTLLPVLRYMGDGLDFVMKMLTPSINLLANSFKILMMPLIELEAVVAQFLAPAFEFVSAAIQGFAIMLDPVIQLVAEVIETFTQLLDSFTGGIPITKIMMDGFEILGQVVKMLVGMIVSILGVFMTGMGGILQLAGLLIQGFGSLVKGVGDLISYLPGMKTIGAALSEAGASVTNGGKAVLKSGEEVQKKGENQRDRGIEKIKEGGENIIGKALDANYKMKDNTRYKSGDVTGVGIRKGSSMGAAVREAQSTSISGVGDEIRKQALMAATGTKTQEESLKDISDKLSKDNLRDAFKEGMIAANGANKGDASIKGKDPFSGAGHSKPSLAPV